MKATGMVRRIDELGRIVIPKEIRKTLRIREGENLEIFTDDNENIILKKHSIVNNIGDFAQKLAESIFLFAKHNIIITDTDNIIAMAGPAKKNYLDTPISEELHRSLQRRELILEKHNKKFKINDDKDENGTYAISSIIANGDVVGLVLMFSNDEKINEEDMKLVQIASQFLVKHLEE